MPDSTDAVDPDMLADLADQAGGDWVDQQKLGDNLAQNPDAAAQMIYSALTQIAHRMDGAFRNLRDSQDHAVAEMYNIMNEGRAHPGGLGAVRKVLELMRRVTVLSKDQKHDAPGAKFMFRSADSAMDAIGTAMRDIGLIGSTQVLDVQTNYLDTTNSSGRKNITCDVRVHVRYIFTDPDDGSTHALEGVSMGRDTSDKAASKAVSMAFKYALFWALMIPTQDMADGDAVQELAERTTVERPAEPKTAVDKTAQAAKGLEAMQATGVTEDQESKIFRHAEKMGLLDVELPGGKLRDLFKAARMMNKQHRSRAAASAPPGDDRSYEYPPPPEPER